MLCFVIINRVLFNRVCVCLPLSLSCFVCFLQGAGGGEEGEGGGVVSISASWHSLSATLSVSLCA